MPIITTTQLREIAGLSRLKIGEKELNKFEQDFFSILNYINKLEKAETSDTNICTYDKDGDLDNVFRDDDIKDCNEGMQEKIIENFIEKENRHAKVDKIF